MPNLVGKRLFLVIFGEGFPYHKRQCQCPVNIKSCNIVLVISHQQTFDWAQAAKLLLNLNLTIAIGYGGGFIADTISQRMIF